MTDFRSAHPGKVSKKTHVWYGVEAEGKYRGQSAVFIAAKPSNAQFAALASKVNEGKCTVVFLTETFDAWGWLGSRLDQLGAAEIVAGRMLHQLDTFFHLPKQVLDRVSVMVRVFDAALLKLRPEDQISIGVPYDLRTFEASDGVRTLPEDYHGDRGL